VEAGCRTDEVDELKADIERLPSEQVAELFHWMSEREWDNWDDELKADSQAGRLDFLVRETVDHKARGTLQELGMHRATARFWTSLRTGYGLVKFQPTSKHIPTKFLLTNLSWQSRTLCCIRSSNPLG
jgi:hypothetical protein